MGGGGGETRNSSHHLHDLPPAAVGTHGQPATDHFAHRRQVGSDPEEALRAVLVHAEARHDLVEAEQRAIALAELLQALEEAPVGLDEARVADDGLEDDPGDLALVGLEDLRGPLQVVVVADEGRGGGGGGDAGGIGQAERRDPGAGLHQEGVRVAVVAPDELQDLVAARERPHQAQDREAGLGAGVDEADHLDGRDAVDHRFRQNILQSAGSSEGRALLELRFKGLGDLGVGVAADGRAPRADEVDVLVPVDVEAVRARHAVEDDGLAADRLEGADGGVDASREEVLGLGEDLSFIVDVVFVKRKRGRGREEEEEEERES